MKANQNSTITKRPASERGGADHGWLRAQHSFSFANYYDPAHMGFRQLRVINDDRIAPDRGFGKHPHQSMEIFTYIVEGALEHKDSMGNGRVIRSGEFQYMSAGDGVEHSEFNPSKTEPVSLLQIWIEPAQKGGTPRYQDMSLNDRRVTNGLTLLASPDGREDSMAIRQQAEILFGDLTEGHTIEMDLSGDFPYAWVQLIKGNLEIADQPFGPGDGAAIEGGNPTISASADAEFLIFKLS